MLARYGGIFSGVDFNVLGNPAEFISKLEFHADIAIFVNLDVVHKLNEDFPVERFDVKGQRLSAHSRLSYPGSPAR